MLEAGFSAILSGALETGRAVIPAGKLKEIAFLIIVIQPSEEPQRLISADILGNGEDGIIGH